MPKHLANLLICFTLAISSTLVGCASPNATATPQEAPTERGPQNTPTQAPITSPEVAFPSGGNEQYPELVPLVNSVSTSLVASPSHPNAYLPGEPVGVKDQVYLVGGDKNSAWLLVLHHGRLGWLPSVVTSLGVGTLNPSIIPISSLESCMEFLGVLLNPSDVWQNPINGRVIVQGLMYNPPALVSTGGLSLSLQVVESGQELEAQIDPVSLATGGKIYTFTAIVEDLPQENHLRLKFGEDNGSLGPFQASFFNDYCSNPQITQEAYQGQGSPNAVPTSIATAYVKITIYDDPVVIPTADWSNCQSSFNSKLNVGMDAMVNSDPTLLPNLHEEPDPQTPAKGDLIPGGIVKVVEGPSCIRGRVWWKVSLTENNQNGWVPEGDGKNYFLFPHGASAGNPPVPSTNGLEQSCAAAYKTRLWVGAKAYVSLDPPYANNVRAKPRRDAKLLGQIPPGNPLEILDGPECSNGWYWWKVRSVEGGLIGWTAEGDNQNYWLIPIE